MSSFAPGIYKLSILIAASNQKPIEKVVQINLFGDWFDDEEMMFSRGVKLEMIES